MKKWLKGLLYLFSGILLIVAVLGIMLYRNLGDLPDENRFRDLPYYKNGQFTNLYEPELPYYPEQATGKGGFIRYDGYTPKARLPMTMLDQNSFGQAEQFAYYWLGHSSAILELSGQRILIDPVFGNANPLDFPLIAPRFQEAPIQLKNLPKLDAVLLTHDHYDHLEADTIRHLAEIGQKYGKFDLAFVEIDASNPGWPKTHMFPEQAVQAAQDLKAKRMLPIHWGVFSLGRNPWYQSIDTSVKTAAEKGVVLDVPKMGEKYQPEHF
ncbi:MBL fold metallo-hydrolase [Actinobacillus equuli]|uniref:MBL fold metallo-hydrolase n=1 Tax=Actinobacillus equuli TaxID=718 RepID=UPI0024432FA5|nr:MBL fold metallo-hydrolase [Actinobacillus equuli]WGE85553.1 MBL fold metallo-hydrolase [Actinobacillus equuli subsp. haemolyticus]